MGHLSPSVHHKLKGHLASLPDTNEVVKYTFQGGTRKGTGGKFLIAIKTPIVATEVIEVKWREQFGFRGGSGGCGFCFCHGSLTLGPFVCIPDGCFAPN